MVFLPVLFMNNHLYGSPLSFAYTSSTNESAGLTAVPASAFLLKIRHILFPFDVQMSNITHAANAYVVMIMPWFFVGVIVFACWLLRLAFMRMKKRFLNEPSGMPPSFTVSQALYIVLFFLISLWLLLYYGSFEFSEFFDRTKIILGSSYLRYWLPIFVFGMPLCLLGFELISRLFSKKIIQRIVLSVLLITFFIFSINLTLLDPLQGLAQLKTNIAGARKLSNEVDRVTPSNAVIISGFADKVFFPSRRVIVAMPSDTSTFMNTVQAITSEAPLYFYFNPLDGYAVSTRSQFDHIGYTLELVEKFTDDNTTLFTVLPY
jgi:hypothetical protein